MYIKAPFLHAKFKKQENQMESIDSVKLVAIIGSIVAAASFITAMTPKPKPGTVLAKIYKLVEIMALCVGKAKDKHPDETK
jgi:hypothetical protein